MSYRSHPSHFSPIHRPPAYSPFRALVLPILRLPSGADFRKISARRMNIVYFDLETQRTANDAGGWDKKRNMGMSVGVTYSTANGEYRIYSEAKVDELVRELFKADLVVGFNILNFDYQVLMGYTILDLPHQLSTLDLLTEVESTVGSKPKLDNIAQSTLGVSKTGDGVDAIKWWREKRVLDIAEYCCFDVKVTRLVHEYGTQNRELFYTDKFNRRLKIPVKW